MVGNFVLFELVIFGTANERFEAYQILDNDDVRLMFEVHGKFEALCTIELYVTFEEVQQTHQQQLITLPETQHTTQSSSFDEQYSQYYQMLQQNTWQFESQPSSSTYAPHTHHEVEERDDEEETDSEHEGIIDESENEEDYHNNIYNSDDNTDNDLTQPIYNPNPISAYNPPPHMRMLDLATIDQQTEVLRSEHQMLPVNQGIAVGMEFHTKKDCARAIKSWHVSQSLDYKIKQSDKSRYVIACNQPLCKFKLRASVRAGGRWMIGIIKDVHTCTPFTLSQDHRKLDSRLISDNIESLLHKDLSVKVKVIIAHITDKFNYTISYRKAWIAKNMAIEKIFGSWEESYAALPQWLTALRFYQPNVIDILETLPNNSGSGLIFHRLFWSFQPLVKGFRFCKPLVQVDGTWLYGKYRGTLLLAVAQDGNNHIFPVAFAIVEGETKEAWSFFLKNLRTYVTPQQGICLISDRHPSIKSAYENPHNGWTANTSTHVYCIRHIAQNFMREIKDKKLRKLVVNMGYAINPPLFAYYRNEIAARNDKALKWVDNMNRAKWTQAFDGGCRWGHMTSNLAESMNSVFKGIRNEPITALVQSTFYKCVELFQRRGTQSAAVVQSGQDYSEACQKQIKDAMNMANTHRVTTFDRQKQTFKVKETMNHNEGRPMGDFMVDLLENWCDCGKFQAIHLPCSHVIAACSYSRQPYTRHINDVYKAASVLSVYDNNFSVIQDQSYWPAYHGPKILPNPEMKRNKKGRPKSTRIMTEMDDFNEPKRCGLCRTPGHKSNNCPNAVGPSR